jgi:hypothetical protein
MRLVALPAQPLCALEHDVIDLRWRSDGSPMTTVRASSDQ